MSTLPDTLRACHHGIVSADEIAQVVRSHAGWWRSRE
ncbi:MAG: hypothetical protein KatS3mg113_0363 [Planctomycetaceae bacterium]|nr:MAG: hypothetical protein KatS3mg113_0363 [Planctomycetaceae bacterium]